MPAGRPLKPAALKIAEGNPGKRPIQIEPEVDGEMPPCPAHLHGIGLTKWKEMAPKLHAAGLLRSVDGDALAAYCEAYHQWREATAILRAEGLTLTTTRDECVARPEVKIQQKANAIMQQLMAQFGLSPKARANLGGAVGPKAPEDPFARAMIG